MKNAGARLYRLGFAVHWIREKSKVPFKSGWTTGPRESWESLEKSYRKGMNVGVRLGRASQFPDGTYLTVIDCDIKDGSDESETAMYGRLLDLKLPITAPQVLSGRGNGSTHFYIRTKEPVAPYRFAQSKDKALVYMPSVPPSKLELNTMDKVDLDKGMRLRYGWEISIMGGGQQVMLPPSIHPDSGRAYAWFAKEIQDYTDIPLVTLAQTTKPQTIGDDAGVGSGGAVFTVAPIDLFESRLSDRVIAMIESGEGVDDRSASLFGCAIAMLKEGYSDDEILTVLTDETTYLGACAFEHAKTTSRTKAAEWVRRFTLGKAKRETSAAEAFKSEVETTVLDDGAAKAQAIEVNTPLDWRQGIERNGDHPGARPKPTLKNICLIINNEAGKDIIIRNDFLNSDTYTRDTPWKTKAGAEVKDNDFISVKYWLSTNYRFEPSTNAIFEALQHIASTNQFHPVREFINGLEWDGKPRLDRWLETYMGATGHQGYLRAVSRKTLVAMIARILKPGCKFDHVLILEGKQGCGKSTAVRILSEPWFSDAQLNIGDKDAILALRMAWVLEIGELSSMRRADIDTLKQFISQPTDRVRLPYGKLAEAFPRQCIFIGTTNSSEYLKDTTGNRRFWPVRVDQCKFEELERDRNQLLAEARFAYDLGEPLYLEEKAIEQQAINEQADRVFIDEWVNQLREFFEKNPDNFPTDKFTINDLFGEWGPFREWKATKGEQMRAADALRALGYDKVRAMQSGERTVLWGKAG